VKKLLLYFSFLVVLTALKGQNSLCRDASAPGSITGASTSSYYFYVSADGDDVDAADVNIQFTGVSNSLSVRVYKDGGDNTLDQGAGDDVLVRVDTLTGGVDSTLLIDDATHDKGDKYFVVVTRGIDGFAGTVGYFIKGTDNGIFGEPTVDISFVGDNSGCLGSTFNVSSTITGDVGDNVTYQRTNDAGILDAWPQLEVDAGLFSITPNSVFDIEVEVTNECDDDDDDLKPNILSVGVSLSVAGSPCVGEEISLSATSSYSGGAAVAMDEWDFFY
jgi:hypothetical protein